MYDFGINLFSLILGVVEILFFKSSNFSGVEFLKISNKAYV